MKTLSIKSNGKEWLLVSVPDDSTKFELEENLEGYNGSYVWLERSAKYDSIDDYRICLDRYCKGAVIHGCYLPSTGEIDFPVKDEWIGKLEKRNSFTLLQAFLSLLKAETEKKWHKENPYGKTADDAIEDFGSKGSNDGSWNEIIKQWEESESKLMPSKLLVIEIK